MKCTDRELLEKLLRLKERADQRRVVAQGRRDRLSAASTAPRALGLRAARSSIVTSQAIGDTQTGGRQDRAVTGSSPEAASEGSIVGLRPRGLGRKSAPTFMTDSLGIASSAVLCA